MSDFSDRPFVAGSLVGLRAFAVDQLGRLVGPSYPQIFTPGDNEAECRKHEDEYGFGRNYLRLMQSAYLYSPPRITWMGGNEVPTVTVETESKPDEGMGLHAAAVAELESQKPKHSLAGLDCHCGFYAYFDGRNDYKQPNNVAAIIEGFGVCTVGTRGFRASKARLVAIVVPGKNFPEAKFSRVVHNYPDVPLYTSRRKAIEAHPLTPPEVPTPETCDDFWTRSAR